MRIVIRLVQEGINQYLPDLLKYIPTPCIDQFQNPLQSCFVDSQHAPPGFFQYAVQSCFIEPLVPEDAHPLKPKTIVKAINAIFFILATLLTGISHVF